METIGYDEIVGMLKGAVVKIRANQDALSKLDSATGDGDHGTAMGKAMNAVEKTIDEAKTAEIKTLLHDIGWNVMCIDGGSTGPLFGSLFMGMSEGAGDRERLDAAALAETFQAGLAKVQKQTKAKPGDKTLMDALVPAVEALAAATEGDIEDALKSAAEAAAEGVEATADMLAKFGRARNLGERSRGHKDPGAASVAHIFQGLYEGITQ